MAETRMILKGVSSRSHLVTQLRPSVQGIMAGCGSSPNKGAEKEMDPQGSPTPEWHVSPLSLTPSTAAEVVPVITTKVAVITEVSFTRLNCIYR